MNVANASLLFMNPMNLINSINAFPLVSLSACRLDSLLSDVAQ